MSRQTYIVFSVAGTAYAIPSEQVQHMEMVESVTAVPNAPPFVEGVVFSRGHVVPVINLRARFGFERTPVDLRSRLLVVLDGTRRVGFLVDDAREFVSIDPEVIHAPGESIGHLSGNYLEGVATLGERIVLVLNVRGILESTPTAAA